MSVVGTDVGTNEYETMTAVDPGIVSNCDSGKLETAENGTTTGDDHDDGTTTVAGT
jgi:hypothetical protein